jgi:hypothetical protein
MFPHRRQAQARHNKLAVLGIPELEGVRYHNGSNGTQPFNNLAGVVASSHMGVAGGEGAIRPREGRIFLDREAEFRHSLIEAPSGEMGAAYKEKCGADPGAGTEAKCGLRMLDRNVGLARLRPHDAADVPTARVIWVESQRAIN